MKRGIILDTNCFSHVFNKEDMMHDAFIDVYEWIIQKKGFLVFGGTSYIRELVRTKKYLKLFNRLKDQGQVIKVDDKMVDAEEVRIRAIISKVDFDDPHLPAIVIVSGCRVICTNDKRCFPYLKDRRIYPRKEMRPKFYSQRRNVSLLNSEYSVI